MSYITYTPGGPLAAFVETFWSRSIGPLASSRQHVCPDAAMALVIHLKNRNLSFYDEGGRNSVGVPLVAGPYSKSFLIDPSEFTAVLGVRFKPGAGRVFFPVPAHELHNIDIALEDLDRAEAARLYEQLRAAAGVHAQFGVLERYLMGKIPRGMAPHPVVEYAVQELSREPGVRAIADVQAETGFSHTRFNQIFRDHVGLTPKLFCRVRRFRAVVEHIESGRPVNWAALAATCGYFDQAHLIHDFRAFSGMTPGAFAPRAAS
jgi:AraC-like DNA-binding protein